MDVLNLFTYLFFLPKFKEVNIIKNNVVIYFLTFALRLPLRGILVQ